MPPRHHYWTIILEGKPTAFRAHLQEELIPTLRQLQARHPDAVLKWFARGRLWDSQEQERDEAIARRSNKRTTAEPRSRDWRPGGEHKDPRDRFKVPRDEKRRRFAQNLRRDRSAPPEDPTTPSGERKPRPPAWSQNRGSSGTRSGPGGPRGGSGGRTGSGGPRTGSGGPRTGSGGPRTGSGGPRTGSGGPRTGSGSPPRGSGGPRTGPGGPRTGSGAPRTGSGAPRGGQRPPHRRNPRGGGGGGGQR